MWQQQLFPKLKSEVRYIRKEQNNPLQCFSLVYNERLILNKCEKKQEASFAKKQSMGAFSPLIGEHFSSTRYHFLSAECIKKPDLTSCTECNGACMQASSLDLTIKN